MLSTQQQQQQQGFRDPALVDTTDQELSPEISVLAATTPNKKKPYLDSQRIARLAQFRRARTPDARNDDGTPRRQVRHRGKSQPRLFYRNDQFFGKNKAGGGAGAGAGGAGVTTARSDSIHLSLTSQDDVTTADGIPSIRSELSNSFSFFDKFRSKHQRKVMYHHFGEIPKEVVTVVEISKIPEPETPHDVIIKVAASTVSHMDCMHRRGVCLEVLDPVSLPSTPGMDAIGSILKCGSAVTQWKEGDRVAAILRTGGNARYVSVPAKSLVEVPRVLDNAEAACMVTTYMTAYQSLKLALKSVKPLAAPTNIPTSTAMSIKSRITAATANSKSERFLQGRRVLITNGISPIGQALIQLCTRAGAEQIFTTAPENRHRYIKSVLGAKALPLDPKVWLPLVQGKMDVVFDGSCDDGFESPHAAIKTRGVMVVFGMSSLLSKEEPGLLGASMTAHWTKIKGQMLMSNTKSYEVWESFQSDPEGFKRDLTTLFALLRKREIKPHIAKRVGLSEVVDAHSYLEKGKARGEIICLPWKGPNIKSDGREGPENDDDDNRTL